VLLIFSALTVAVEPLDHMRSVAQRNPAIRVFVNHDRAIGQRAAKAGFLDLPHQLADRRVSAW
jgi:hypothetical protein